MAFKIDIGIEGLAKGLERDLAREITQDVRAATEALKSDLREETAVAFSLSHRLPKAWRSTVYPRSGDSVSAAGVVQVKKTAANIIESALAATVIVARGGRWLAIPTPEAGKFGLKIGVSSAGATTAGKGNREKVTPRGWERRTGLKLRYIPGKTADRAVLVVDNAMYDRRGKNNLIRGYRSKGRGSRLYGPAGRTLVVFILVRSVTTKKRIDLDAVVERAAARGAQMMLSGWRN